MREVIDFFFWPVNHILSRISNKTGNLVLENINLVTLNIIQEHLILLGVLEQIKYDPITYLLNFEFAVMEAILIS